MTQAQVIPRSWRLQEGGDGAGNLLTGCCSVQGNSGDGPAAAAAAAAPLRHIAGFTASLPPLWPRPSLRDSNTGPSVAGRGAARHMLTLLHINHPPPSEHI